MICVFVTCNQKCSAVFFYVMASQVQPQEEMQERHKKTNFIILTGLEGSDGLPYRVTGKAPEFGFYLQAEDKKKGKAEARTFLQLLWERQGSSG